MPRFAANLTLLFRELPFLDRFEAAAGAGFLGVEVLFPYDDAVSEITRRLKHHKLDMVPIKAPPPNRGRQEPLAGEIDCPAFFRRLETVGYAGWVSGEYNPAGRTADGPVWIG